jgi:hypothetical protein
MTNTRTYLAVALLLASIGSAHAGMSGTSARVQQHAISEAQGAVQAPPPAANPVAQAPQRQQGPARQQQPQARPSGGNFDGVWATTASPGCGLAARSAVEIVRGRISGSGISGSVTPSGQVRTVAHGGGASVISTGRIVGNSASGTYEVSNGCIGTWTASKV